MSNNKNIFDLKFLVLALFFIVAFSVYSSSINSSFHFDDVPNITSNPNVAINNLSFETLKNAALNNEGKIRAFSYLSFALNYYVSGEHTTSYHVVNVIIHAINAFLIYLIILRLFDYDALDGERKRALTVSAFFTALLWLVTPLNSQAVILIVQRMTLLMTLFFLLAFLMYLLGRKRANARYFALSFIFFALSVLSKENGITLPLVIILHEFIFVNNGDLKSVSKKEKLILIALALVLLFPIFSYRAIIFSYFSKSKDFFGFTITQRMLTQFRVHIFYLSLLIMPLPARLCLTHDIVKSTSLFSPITTLLSLLLLVALFVFSILRIKKSPYLSFAILFFFITVSVEAIVPLEMAYEHRMYLAEIFLIGAFVKAIVDRFYEKNSKAVLSSFLGVAIILSALTGVRGKAWKDEVTLWGDAVKKYPDDARGNYSLGTSLIDKDNSEAKRYLAISIEEMLADLYDSQKFKLVMAYENYGIVLRNLKEDVPAEQAFLSALKYDKNHVTAYIHLGILYYEREDYKRALEMYQSADKINPNNADTIRNIGIMYYMLGDYENTLTSFRKALKIDPNNQNLPKMIMDVENKIGAR